jgi:hypothetical protein
MTVTNDLVEKYGAVDITPVLRKTQERYRRLYGQDREWMPPSMKRPFHPVPVPHKEIDEFDRTHIPPNEEVEPAVVLRRHFPPIAYYVVADCDCEWCCKCRAHGIQALAHGPYSEK